MFVEKVVVKNELNVGKVEKLFSRIEWAQRTKISLVNVGGRVKQKFGFIKRVDKGWVTTVKDVES